MSDDTIIPFPSNNKAMKQARQWLDERRGTIEEDRENHQELMEGLMEGITDAMSSLGIQTVIMGDTHIQISEPATPKPSASARWTQHLSEGGEVFILEVNTSNVMYYDSELVDANDQTLDDLVDVERIQTLASDAVVYGPGQEVPWANLFPLDGFKVWLTSREDLQTLWAHLDQWVKTDWHDNVMAQSKYPRTLKEVAHARITRIVAQDLDLRVGRYYKLQAQVEASDEHNAWDASAQADLKRAISALICVEQHPSFGSTITQTIETLLPHLASSMDAKNRMKTLQKDLNKAREHLYKGFTYTSVDWQECSKTLPQI